jgi:ABC-2 type transport system ATP-binding protein
VGIIGKGQLLFQGTINELQQQRKSEVHIVVDNTDTAMNILNSKGIQSVIGSAQQLVLDDIDNATMGAINTMLIQQGLTVSSLSRQQNDLESLFLHITQQ